MGTGNLVGVVNRERGISSVMASFFSVKKEMSHPLKVRGKVKGFKI